MKQKTRQARQVKQAHQAEQKQTRQARQSNPTRTILARQAFSCPNCLQLYRRGDRFCGYCHTPLQLQCPQCGRWTKAKHLCCPDCGTLLRGRFSFDEKRQLETLRQTYQNLQLDYEYSVKHLNEAYRGRRHTVARLMVAGVLIGSVVVGVPMALANLVASFAGIVFLLVVVVVFRRLFWGLPRLAGRFWRWVEPGALAHWRQVIEEEQDLRSSLEDELNATTRSIAALDLLIDPLVTEEEEDQEDAEEEEDQEYQKDTGSPKRENPSGQKLLTWLKAGRAWGEQVLPAARSLLSRIRNRRTPNHPRREDLIQNPDKQPAQPGEEEEEEDLIENPFDD